ncbi:MAG: UDP-N-acetylenolpyruvoylglucosamine reductase, partial [Firmicutes bacterium]|nr:UDP-N-acetylenolpyruvoylglucosamine reductase [Candidatus Caballimonas caccae]
PLGYHAGSLIESVSLKGYSVGGARVSIKHANFIINENNAQAKDIKTIIDKIKKKIKEIYNIELKEEIEYVGKFDEAFG